AAWQRPHHAAHDRAADRRADAAHRTLRHRLDEAVLAAAPLHQAAERVGDRADDASRRRAWRADRWLLCRGGDALGELFVRRLAIDRLFVDAVDRRRVDHRL